VDVDESYLLMSNPISSRFEPIAHWAPGKQTGGTEGWDPTVPCSKCFEPPSSIPNSIHLCRKDNETSPHFAYSLVVNNSRTALLKFRLRPGLQLDMDQEKIFNNIVDEIAFALHAAQDHKRISELQSAEVAMAERRMVSAYVHDQIGQNLGYLHLKLDQLGKHDMVLSSQDLRKEVEHLRDTANDSYEIVRDILKRMQPETIPNLTNLLKEHAARVARATNFKLNFRATGVTLQLPPEIQQTIFYAFHETVSNVEKHSRASCLDVLVTWGDSFLDISVADNGIGFDPASVRKEEHFGLEILRERVNHLKGQVMIDSSENAGTVVSISIPLPTEKRVAHEQTDSDR
jgi:two-component system nitrate/nitrite sensor histidine kinase NarX